MEPSSQRLSSCSRHITLKLDAPASSFMNRPLGLRSLSVPRGLRMHLVLGSFFKAGTNVGLWWFPLIWYIEFYSSLMILEMRKEGMLWESISVIWKRFMFSENNVKLYTNKVNRGLHSIARSQFFPNKPLGVLGIRRWLLVSPYYSLSRRSSLQT